MKRTNDEFRDEIFSRSEKIIKKRRKIKRIVMCCAPLFLCAIVTVYILAMTNGIKANSEADNRFDNAFSKEDAEIGDAGASLDEEAILDGDKNSGSTTHYVYALTIENCKNGTSSHLLDEEKARTIEYLMGNILSTGEICEKTTEAEYNITLHCNAGETTQFSIAGNALICEDAVYKISDADLQKILDIIEGH